MANEIETHNNIYQFQIKHNLYPFKGTAQDSQMLIEGLDLIMDTVLVGVC